MSQWTVGLVNLEASMAHTARKRPSGEQAVAMMIAGLPWYLTWTSALIWNTTRGASSCTAVGDLMVSPFGATCIPLPECLIRVWNFGKRPSSRQLCAPCCTAVGDLIASPSRATCKSRP